MTPSPTRIAFVGSGNIASPYAESVALHDELALIGVFDIDAAKRSDFARAHSIRDYESLGDLVTDAPDIVVNLTSAPYHYATTRDLIERGVTVFSEKPLALQADQAQELVELAEARGVRLACAPSLWLGEAELQVAAALREGTIGTVRLINAEVNQGRIETWHPVPFSFYQVGPVVDAGVYPLTFLTAIFGPIRHVTASNALVLADRTTQAGDPFTVTTADVWQITAQFESGPLLRLSCTFYVDSATQPRTIDFHGDLGSLRLDDWIQPGSGIQHAVYGEPFASFAEPDDSRVVDWSLGVLDLAEALRENRPHRTNAQHAAHVVEVLNAVARAAEEEVRVDVHSTFPLPITADVESADPEQADLEPASRRAQDAPGPELRTVPVRTKKVDTMTTLSYMGANLVAQQLDWNMSDGWMQGDAAANLYYEPIATFPQRFGAFVELVVASGFSSLDVWSGQLNWTWATPAHIDAANAALQAAGVSVTSYAGFLGETPDDFAASCALASALGAPLMSGRTSLLTDDRQSLFRILTSTGRRLAIENHPESSPQQILDLIGTDGDGLLGTAIDTGWWATQGFDAAQAVRELAPFTLHVHLKDIRAAGAHDTCAFGEGIVPLEACVDILAETGFGGPISVEHEPEHFDPKDDVIASRMLLEGWLGASIASK